MTDSIFITIPIKDATKLSTEEKWKIAENCAQNINELISKYTKEYLLPRQNIDPKYCETFFKTELLFSSIMFLDVKKNYAFKLIVREGKIINPPIIKYTGIPIVKSDAARITQMLLKSMIDDVILNEQIEDYKKLDHIMQIVVTTKEKFVNDYKSYNFEDIGLPGKWMKKEIYINGMKAFNDVVEKEIFTFGSAGKFIYCQFRNPAILKSVDYKKTSGICIPYNYNPELLKQKMLEKGVEFDISKHWETIFTKICQRVIGLAKKTKGSR